MTISPYNAYRHLPNDGLMLAEAYAAIWCDLKCHLTETHE